MPDCFQRGRPYQTHLLWSNSGTPSLGRTTQACPKNAPSPENRTRGFCNSASIVQVRTLTCDGHQLHQPVHNAFAASAGIALEAEYRALGATGIAGQRLPCRASMYARSTTLMRV